MNEPTEIVGFKPLETPTLFQGRPVESSGLIGFKPISEETANTFEFQKAQLDKESQASAEAALGAADKQSDELAKSKGFFRTLWNDVLARPLVDASTVGKALPFAREIGIAAGNPFVPTEEDWSSWLAAKLGKLNREMFPGGQTTATEWMTQQNAPAELLKTYRKEFESDWVGVPQGGVPKDQQSTALNIASGVVKGVENAFSGTASFLTTPVGLAGAGLASGGGKLAGVVGTVFAGDMAIGSVQNWSRFVDAVKKGDTQEASEAFTDATISTLFTGLLSYGSYKGLTSGGNNGKGMAPYRGQKPMPPTTVIVGEQGKLPSTEPFFEQRDGESWKSVNKRIEDFNRTHKRVLEDIDAEIIPPNQIELPGSVEPGRPLIEDGPGPILVRWPLHDVARRRIAVLKRASELLGMAKLQDNPILIDSGHALIESVEFGNRKVQEGGKLLDRHQDDPFNQLPTKYRVENDPVPFDINNKEQQRQVLQVALERVLGIEQTEAIQSANPVEKPWEIRQKLQERSRSTPPSPTQVSIPREAAPEGAQNPSKVSAPQSAPQNPVATPPSDGVTLSSSPAVTLEPGYAPPKGAVEARPPQRVVKPWEIRQRLQERSRSAGEPIKMSEPTREVDLDLPTMPGVRGYVEVPDSHPAVMVWKDPMTEKYSKAKAHELFPDNPAFSNEVAQEAHAHLYLSASSMPPNFPNPKAWSFRVITNYLLDKARGIQRERARSEVAVEGVRSALETEPDKGVSPREDAMMSELESMIDSFTKQLNPADKMVWDAMSGTVDMEFAEVARVQETSPSTITRRAQELRRTFANTLRKAEVDTGDYLEVVEKLHEGKSEPAPDNGIGASARRKLKGGKDEGGFFNPAILAPLGRIIKGWMRAGVSAVRAIGHAVKMFGGRVLAPATRIARAWGFGVTPQLAGLNRPMRPFAPFVPGVSPVTLRATARHPNRLGVTRPANWAALDTMRRAGLRKMADAGDKFEDRKAELIGRWVTPQALIEQKYSVAEYKQGEKQRDNYFKLRESRDNGKTPAQAMADANAFYFTTSPAARELIQWTRAIARESGAIHNALGVQVQTSTGHWRPGNYNNEHYPRRPTEELKEMLRDPVKHASAFNSLLNEMVAQGTAQTRGAAEKIVYHTGWADKSSTGFFTNSEKARGPRLPDKYYEYSTPDFVNYVDATAERLAQIEAFGQSLGGKRVTLFEEEASKTTDPKLRQAVLDLRNHYYRDPNTTMHGKAVSVTGDIVTNAYLGMSPLTAGRNVAASLMNSTIQYGVAPTVVHSGRIVAQSLEAAVHTTLNLMNGELKVQRTKDALFANEIGAVMHDMKAASMMELSSSTAIGKASSFWMSTNTIAERFGRTVNASAALTWLRHSQAIINRNQSSYMARSRRAQLERLGFSGAKLARLLAGDHVEGQEFLRKAVADTNFGYRAKHSSTDFDSSWAAVFGKFMKYGFMMSRFVDINTIKPLTQKVDGKWTPNVLPLAKLLLFATIAGEGYKEAREHFFNKPRKDASLSEIRVSLSEDKVKTLKLIADRVTSDLIYGSAFGIVGDLAGYAKDFATRGRFKNPFDPPAFTLAEQITEPFIRRYQRGMTLEGIGDDLQSVLSRFPSYNQLSGAIESVQKKADSTKGAGALAESVGARSSALPLLLRFGKEMGVNRPSKFNSSSAVLDENSAELDAISRHLMSGNADAARDVAKEFVKNAPNRDSAIRTLTGSVSRRNPLFSSVAGIDTPEKVDAFIKWVNRFDPEKAKLYRKVALRYDSAAGKL